jgi:hypothetical protein
MFPMGKRQLDVQRGCAMWKVMGIEKGNDSTDVVAQENHLTLSVAFHLPLYHHQERRPPIKPLVRLRHYAADIAVFIPIVNTSSLPQ